MGAEKREICEERASLLQAFRSQYNFTNLCYLPPLRNEACFATLLLLILTVISSESYTFYINFRILKRARNILSQLISGRLINFTFV